MFDGKVAPGKDPKKEMIFQTFVLKPISQNQHVGFKNRPHAVGPDEEKYSSAEHLETGQS